MAKCAICEKAAHFGNAVSHSHRRSNKKWNANVKVDGSKLGVITDVDGQRQSGKLLPEEAFI